MLTFDHLEEAIIKAEFLKELCYGVRLIGDNDGSVLYSSLTKTDEDQIMKQPQPVERKGYYAAARARNERALYWSRGRRTYEITRIPVEIDKRGCTLEMIQPYNGIITAVTGATEQSSTGQEHLLDTIGGMIWKDTLTGLFNRRYIDEYLPVAINTSCDRECPLSLMFADIDHFKAINDRYGHLAGDLVLQHIAQLLKKNIRHTDCWVARFGGDEFLVCLPGVDSAAAHQIANRIRLAVMNESFPLESGFARLTCSFGVHTAEAGDLQRSALTLLKSADDKLMLAKRAGRNKVL